jgi:hypothetical protein
MSTPITIPSFTITGIRATAITNATASYNAAQLKLNSAFVALTPAQWFQQQIENQQTAQASQEISRQLKDPTTGAFVDAVMSAPVAKRSDLIAISQAP